MRGLRGPYRRSVPICQHTSGIDFGGRVLDPAEISSCKIFVVDFSFAVNEGIVLKFDTQLYLKPSTGISGT